ncbi:hypothetical protein CJJ23_00400 [Mycoplasmopsis agassizii]|uniref:Uncharacterized protein n=2 Tax=Mycoplasmopsis agassizii TaxID=33922 RepID=A0A269TJZ9_9BACT|nr:hypothetical protein CJJ23_00400 [Mycoplasmopsis agassizii]
MIATRTDVINDQINQQFNYSLSWGLFSISILGLVAILFWPILFYFITIFLSERNNKILKKSEFLSFKKSHYKSLKMDVLIKLCVFISLSSISLFVTWIMPLVASFNANVYISLTGHYSTVGYIAIGIYGFSALFYSLISFINLRKFFENSIDYSDEVVKDVIRKLANHLKSLALADKTIKADEITYIEYINFCKEAKTNQEKYDRLLNVYFKFTKKHNKKMDIETERKFLIALIKESNFN